MTERTSTSIRPMTPGEEETVCRLAASVCVQFVAPLYTDEGVAEFLRTLDPQRMAERSRSGHLVLLAEREGQLVGLIEVRALNHISLLFVARGAQCQGVARRLLNEAVRICREHVPGLREISVHASPNAVGAYERLGFRVEGSEQLEHGMRYVPLTLRLGAGDKRHAGP